MTSVSSSMLSGLMSMMLNEVSETLRFQNMLKRPYVIDTEPLPQDPREALSI